MSHSVFPVEGGHLQSTKPSYQKNKLEIQNLLQKLGNNICAECSAPINSENAWAVLSLGVLVCEDCKLVHIEHQAHALTNGQSSTTIVSTGEVLCCLLPNLWTENDIAQIEENGNIKSNEKLLKNVPVWYYRPCGNDSIKLKEHWIKLKYNGRIAEVKDKMENMASERKCFTAQFLFLTLEGGAISCRAVLKNDVLNLTFSDHSEEILMEKIETIVINSKRIGHENGIQIVLKKNLQNGDGNAISCAYLQHENMEMAINWMNFVLYTKYKVLKKNYPTMAEENVAKILNCCVVKESYIQFPKKGLVYLSLTEARLACFSQHLDDEPLFEIAVSSTMNLTASQYLDTVACYFEVDTKRISCRDEWITALESVLKTDKIGALPDDVPKPKFPLSLLKKSKQLASSHKKPCNVATNDQPICFFENGVKSVNKNSSNDTASAIHQCYPPIGPTGDMGKVIRGELPMDALKPHSKGNGFSKGNSCPWDMPTGNSSSWKIPTNDSCPWDMPTGNSSSWKIPTSNFCPWDMPTRPLHKDPTSNDSTTLYDYLRYPLQNHKQQNDARGNNVIGDHRSLAKRQHNSKTFSHNPVQMGQTHRFGAPDGSTNGKSGKSHSNTTSFSGDSLLDGHQRKCSPLLPRKLLTRFNFDYIIPQTNIKQDDATPTKRRKPGSENMQFASWKSNAKSSGNFFESSTNGFGSGNVCAGDTPALPVHSGVPFGSQGQFSAPRSIFPGDHWASESNSKWNPERNLVQTVNFLTCSPSNEERQIEKKLCSLWKEAEKCIRKLINDCYVPALDMAIAGLDQNSIEHVYTCVGELWDLLLNKRYDLALSFLRCFRQIFAYSRLSGIRNVFVGLGELETLKMIFLQEGMSRLSSEPGKPSAIWQQLKVPEPNINWPPNTSPLAYFSSELSPWGMQDPLSGSSWPNSSNQLATPSLDQSSGVYSLFDTSSTARSRPFDPAPGGASASQINLFRILNNSACTTTRTLNAASPTPPAATPQMNYNPLACSASLSGLESALRNIFRQEKKL